MIINNNIKYLKADSVYLVTFLVTPGVLVQLLEQSKKRGEKKTR